MRLTFETGGPIRRAPRARRGKEDDMTRDAKARKNFLARERRAERQRMRRRNERVIHDQRELLARVQRGENPPIGAVQWLQRQYEEARRG